MGAGQGMQFLFLAQESEARFLIAKSTFKSHKKNNFRVVRKHLTPGLVTWPWLFIKMDSAIHRINCYPVNTY